MLKIGRTPIQSLTLNQTLWPPFIFQIAEILLLFLSKSKSKKEFYIQLSEDKALCGPP